jgi:[acyl-carrier-protein] S-malonyltransferase
MGRAIAEAFPKARETFAEIDEALDQNLSRLMFEGPEDALMLTANAQPALMAVSLAVMRVLEQGGLEIRRDGAFVAGHSLGEYSALAAAHSIDVTTAARLLRRRGLAMQRATPIGQGAMAAILGLDLDVAREVTAMAAQGEVCTAANDNGPGQVVVSGDRDAVERAVAQAVVRGARRAIMLAVSAPFHCALMAPAAREMEEALADIRMVPPAVPLVANVTASPVTAPETIKRLLVEQVTGLVRWRESVLKMKEEGVDYQIEIGSGKVLTGLAKRIDRGLAASAIGTPGEIDAFLRTV